jgi:hypothetical protein
MFLIYWLAYVLTVLPSIISVKAVSVVKLLYSLYLFRTPLTAFDIETRALLLVTLLGRYL